MAKNRHNRSSSSYKRRREHRTASNTFLVVTEGEVTEPEYIRALARSLRMSVVDICVTPSAIGTDPLHVVEHADKLRKRQQQESRRDPAKVPYDCVWVVFDQEGNRDGRDWKNAIHRAKALKINVVLSNPAFELWLLLHHEYTTAPFANASEVERRLKRSGNDAAYSKAGGKTDFAGIYLPKTAQAVKHAKQLRRHNQQTGTENPRTNADELVEALNLSVRNHNRIF